MSDKIIRLNLALQGGGAHGAFTWGVLDRLLDQPNIEIEKISGTSAGALNGAAFATGYAIEGREGAKKHLAQAGFPLTFMLSPLRKPGMGVWDDVMPLLSPYQTNPLGIAPLKYILSSVVDEGLLRANLGPELFVNAVHVATGYGRVFGPSDMSIDSILASACAPDLFQAVQIEGESYWDGSYVSNPPLWPLYEASLDVDILMVELTPLERPETPTTAKNILNRMNEIASINGLVSEFQALVSANRETSGRGVRFHVISMPEEASKLEIEPSIKRTVAVELFESLHQTGHAACDRWLAQHGDKLGLKSSIDIHDRYLTPYKQGRSFI
jgi:NTE family protein